MSYLSIRKLPPELNQAILQEVQKRQTTKSKVVIEALKQVFHLSGPPSIKVLRNTRGFFGKMSQKEYQEFQKLQKGFSVISVIEEEMWK